FCRRQQINDGAVSGEQLISVAQTNVIQRRRAARETVISRGIVVLLLVKDAADQSKLVRHLSQTRQALADENTGRARRDGFEFAPDRFGGVGLHIYGVGLTGAAELVQKDNGLRPCRAVGSLLPGLQEPGPMESQAAKP